MRSLTVLPVIIYCLKQKVEMEQTQKQEQKQKELSLLKPIMDEMGKDGLEFAELANENNQLFGSINEETLKKSLRQKYNLNMENRELKINLKLVPESKNVIRHIGSYTATLSCHQFPDIKIDFPVTVKALKR